HPDDARLLQRRHLGEDRRAFDEIAKRGIIEAFRIPAQHRLTDLETDLATNLARHDHVVAGENFDGDAVITQRSDCGAGGLLWRIEKRKEALYDKFVLVGHGILLLGMAGRKLTGRNCNDTEAVFVVLACHGHEGATPCVVERYKLRAL